MADSNQKANPTKTIVIVVAVVLSLALVIYIARPAEDSQVNRVDNQAQTEEADTTVSDTDSSGSDNTNSSSANTNSSTSQTVTNVTVDQPNPSSGQEDTGSSQPDISPGLYLDYSEAAFAQYSDSVRLLNFHANWCSQCRALDSDIKAKTIPDGVVIFKVDFDNSSALKRQYGVVQQTTVVRVDSDGNLVDKFGAYALPTLQAVTDALL